MKPSKPLRIPFMVLDRVSTPPTKHSGHRELLDLDQLALIPDEAQVLIQYNQKSYWCTKAQLITPLTTDGLWDDYVGSLLSGEKQTTNQPSFDEYLTGLRANNFSVGDEMWISIHVKHDWKPGTDIYPHVHWLTDDASPAGDAVWQIQYSVAKRNDTTPPVFPAVTTISLTTAMTVQNGHVVSEASDLQAIPAAEIEVDCLIELHITRITDGGAGGDAKNLFGLQLDLHYQKDRIGTELKVPPFRT